MLEIKDFTVLLAKDQRMKLMILKKNKVRDRERNKCRAIDSFSTVWFKRPNNAKHFSFSPLQDIQNVGFHRDRSVS